MNRKECMKSYKSPLVQKIQELAWKDYKKTIKKKTKRDEKMYKRGVKQAFMKSCVSRKKLKST
jgi:hypothetical protein